MNTKKKSRFLSFCFSLLPGAAEMYMGFMKAGTSLMLTFFLLIAVSGWVNQTILIMFDVVIWFYGFFHANHLASLSDEEFAQVTDEYLLGWDLTLDRKKFVGKYQKWIACGLIFVGAVFLWDTLANLLRNVLPEEYAFVARIMWRIGNYAPGIIIGCGIIFLGVRLLNGKSVEVVSAGENTPDESNQAVNDKANGQQEEK